MRLAGVTITINAGGIGSATGDGSVGTDTFTGGVNGALGGNFADIYNAAALARLSTRSRDKAATTPSPVTAVLRSSTGRLPGA